MWILYQCVNKVLEILLSAAKKTHTHLLIHRKIKSVYSFEIQEVTKRLLILTEEDQKIQKKRDQDPHLRSGSSNSFE